MMMKTTINNHMYMVAHGYDLYFEKNDKDILLVKCCKEKAPQCPFRLWASWMKEEKTFQIKSRKKPKLIKGIQTWVHCNLQVDRETICESILESTKMSLRLMKSLVSNTFNINANFGQCMNAKRFVLCEI